MPVLPITIRTARASDADTLVAFNAAMALETENLTLDRAVLASGVRAALADETKATYYVAVVDGDVVGQLMITHEWSDWRDGDIRWIESVYVHPGHRGRGVFSSLYRHVEHLARDRRAAGIRLYVETQNASARATYGKLGMQLTPYAIMECIFKSAGEAEGA
ncbi:MAG TPA: GNAT family N-acetyltransferase [Tepidisphaeraceae bacterium]|nr:GNAT family N-acetyltransferase [Tepidisphaeraceae bacterium]